MTDEMARDRSMFVLSGNLAVRASRKKYALGAQDAERAQRGKDYRSSALEDRLLAAAFAPLRRAL